MPILYHPIEFLRNTTFRTREHKTKKMIAYFITFNKSLKSTFCLHNGDIIL
jgi:hypothetical protein